MMALGCLLPGSWSSARHARGTPLQKFAKERRVSDVILGLLSLAEDRFTSGDNF
jgi:hypothetical protein